MMTAKEYVEDKVKSYTRLAERCRRLNAAGEKPKPQMTLSSGPDTPHGQTSGRCAPKKWTTCGRCCKRNLGRSRMPDTVLHVMWYTVYDAKKRRACPCTNTDKPKG